MIWTTRPDLDELARSHHDTAVSALGIEFTAVGDAELRARMPVDARTVQPYGLLHGGASVLLAETLGSCAASYCIDRATQICVGVEINASHVRGARSGWVHGVATPTHVGRTLHVWDIAIDDDEGRRLCVSRLTVAVLPKQA